MTDTNEILNRLELFVHGLGKAVLRELREALAQQGEPVAYLQVYRCGIKSRDKIRAEIPREKQGWWADVCPGETLRLRQAVQSDIDRCSLNSEHSRNPDDYMCETFTSGALVSKYAIEFMNPEQNVFARVAAAQPTP